MLTALELENFKAFGDRTRIELAPITLIYGQNSAGKSSILQALSLLKQTTELGEQRPDLLLRAKEGLVDLGTARSVLFNHDTDRPLRIGVEVAAVKRVTSGRARRGGAVKLALAPLQAETAGVVLGFGFVSEHGRDFLRLTECSLVAGSPAVPIALFASRKATNEERNLTHDVFKGGGLVIPPHLRQPLVLVCKEVSRDSVVWDSIYNSWRRKRKLIHRVLTGQDDNYQPWEDSVADDGCTALAADFYSRQFSRQDLAERLGQRLVDTAVALNGILPCGDIVTGSRLLPEFHFFRETQDGDGFPSREGLAPGTLNVIGRLGEVSSHVSNALKAVDPIGPIRQPPRQWEVLEHDAPDGVGSTGRRMGELLAGRPGVKKILNGWLEQLGIGYEVAEVITDQAHNGVGVRLRDTRLGGSVKLALTDVGVGISQLLPFIVQALATRDRIISIEQPEVHIHPRLQADLGELLAECIGSTYNHQFLIETHSEHLVLRMQRLIRRKKLRPSDVSVLFVERGLTGSRVKRLRLDEHGEFIDEWPGGFFSERLREFD